ncbi:barstar family protein [Pseudomonas sp. SK3(2021)]|uniref:barstar family protein n=1 Tax=Pseudomonas sp. SK3(2021) TaxID=2841064 RepID=UPI00192C5E90|nr:barstar family protein [Pseudomonas sp. SK3(2021)]QQZ39793.1 barstar family protein [Pseudomonas sp. SK3(2021)]
MTRLQQVDIDVNAVTSTVELHATLRDALGFPDWYGANWDAFRDAITGLVEMPVQLEFHGWDELATRLPRDARLLRQCLEKMTVHYPEFAPQVTFG